jgi:hypothetical protein
MTKLTSLASFFQIPQWKKSVMISRENNFPTYPLVEAAVKAVVDWVTRYRNAIGSKDEFGVCGRDEVARMAKDIGV